MFPSVFSANTGVSVLFLVSESNGPDSIVSLVKSQTRIVVPSLSGMLAQSSLAIPSKTAHVDFRDGCLLGTLLQCSSNDVPLSLCLDVSVPYTQILLCEWSHWELTLHGDLHHLCYVLKAFWSAL